MKNLKMAIYFIAILLIASLTQAEDFVLEDSQHLNITTSYNNGVLLDFSTADVLQGGYISNAYVNDEATLDVQQYPHEIYSYNIFHAYVYNNSTLIFSGGSGYVLTYTDAYNTSTVDITGGGDAGPGHTIRAYDSSTVNLSGGSADSLRAYDSSTMNLSGGSVDHLYVNESSTVNLSGGSVDYLYVNESSTVNLSGGSVDGLNASESSIITIYGYDIRALPGETLSIVDDEVIGTGLLTGKWMDGTSWVIPIDWNETTATILLIHEPLPICPQYPRMDFNLDCKVDLVDFAEFASHWMECNLEPQSACWE